MYFLLDILQIPKFTQYSKWFCSAVACAEKNGYTDSLTTDVLNFWILTGTLVLSDEPIPAYVRSTIFPGPNMAAAAALADGASG